MTKPMIPCPNCNAPQEFKPRYTAVDAKGNYAMWIKCTMCRQTKHIKTITHRELVLRRRIERNT